MSSPISSSSPRTRVTSTASSLSSTQQQEGLPLFQPHVRSERYVKRRHIKEYIDRLTLSGDILSAAHVLRPNLHEVIFINGRPRPQQQPVTITPLMSAARAGDAKGVDTLLKDKTIDEIIKAIEDTPELNGELVKGTVDKLIADVALAQAHAQNMHIENFNPPTKGDNMSENGIIILKKFTLRKFDLPIDIKHCIGGFLVKIKTPAQARKYLTEQGVSF